MNNHQTKLELPLVSVIIPAYNAESFIEKTLDSVLAQTYKNLEILVIDDGSQDRTAEIVEHVTQRDCRVILLRQPNTGVAAARNLGIQKSKGEYIAPIDADDIWFPQNIEKQVQYMIQAEPSVGLVYAWSADIDEKGLLIGECSASSIEGQVYSTLVCHDFLGNASCSLIRRACFEKVGGYNCQLKEQNAQGGEDLELYLRIAEYYQFRVVPEFLIGYRKLSSSMSCDYTSMAKSRYLIWQSIQQKYPGIPAAIYRLSSSSYYMYLARQSSQHGRHQSTLFWLYKALCSDFITPFLRFGLYKLTVKSLLKIMTQPVTSLIWSDHRSWVQSKRRFKYEHRVTALSELKERRTTARFKVMAENILHQLIPVIFGTPKTWKNYKQT